MYLTPLIQRSLVTLAVLATFGILIHDTKFDKAASLALALPIGLTLSLASMPELRSEGHTHVERAAFEKGALMTNGLPRIQPRDDRRRFVLPKLARDFNNPEPHTLVLGPSLA